MSNTKTLPTPSPRRSAHNTPVLASRNTARGCTPGGTPDPWGSDEAHPHSARHSARRRSSGACPRSCKRIPPEQGPGPSAAENSLTRVTSRPAAGRVLKRLSRGRRLQAPQPSHPRPESRVGSSPYTPQSARLQATSWGASQAPVLPVARQRVRRRASRSSLRCSLGLGAGKSAGPTRMPWLPRAMRARSGGATSGRGR
jgi:hypothetical protein